MASMNLSSPDFENLIGRSAILSGQKRYDEATSIVESRLGDMDAECYLNAYLEIFYASRESGNDAKALQYAKKLLAIDPGLPGARQYADQRR